jgi:hypothetical protein
MACGCSKPVRGFEPGTVQAFYVVVDGECVVTWSGECIPFATREAADSAAAEQGFAQWELAEITV